ncbi:MAG TPA: hypothetical protein VLZ83_10045 [Edaphocola sp.]|nr:hypothetical protein [Edaphocola sp.]
MRKVAFLSIIILISTNVFSQSVESIVERVSNEICYCMRELTDKSELRKKLKECSDDKINHIMNNSTKAENKVLLKGNNLKIVISQIEPYVVLNCENVNRIIKQDLENDVDKVSNDKSTIPCPTNFTAKDLKNIKKLDGEIIAFNGLVTKVHSAHNDKPYYEVKLEGGNTIWIASLVNSGYEKEGKIIRLLGYISKVENDEVVKKYNKTNYHILAFCIIDLNSKQMAMLPGSELQVKEWMNGKIPKSKE